MTTIHKIVPAFLLVLFLCFLPVADCFADAPSRLNYQGIITDSVGQPVTGQKTILFSLYSDANGGTAFWSETQSVLLDSNGRFSATLGLNTPLNKDQFTGTTFLGIKIGEDPELAPRQQLTSVAYALQTAAGVPTGGIIMWSGSVANIPSGWALCDGNNSTPNLKDKFIVGSGGSYAVGATGGAATHTLSIDQIPSHNHGGATGTDYPDHTHGISADGGQDNSDGPYARFDSGAQGAITSWGANARHQHAISPQGGGQPHNNMPPYYALAYIIKL